MRVLTCNVNGIRAAQRKGFQEWCLSLSPDVICLQEVRPPNSEFYLNWPQYTENSNFSSKPGYSGVTTMTKAPSYEVRKGIGHPLLDTEGRVIEVKVGDTNIVNAYFPSGSSREERQEMKMQFLAKASEHFSRWISEKTIICGDFNIAHRKIDLKNWRGNLKSSGFLPEEREWFDSLLYLGFRDTFRQLYPEIEAYTWWSQRGKARERNIGWRIDYQIVSPCLEKVVNEAMIYRELSFSDHAPYVVNYVEA